MEKHAYEIKAAIAAAGAFFTALWGWFGWLVLAFGAFMLADYITGSWVAKRSGQWASKQARQGLVGKGVMLLVVACAGVLDLVAGVIIANMPAALPFTYSVFICPLALVWYIITEFGSVLENAIALGIHLPPFLVPVVKGMKAAAEKAAPEISAENEKDL